jgi:tetratricopeptide (TPR) repeat protein
MAISELLRTALEDHLAGRFAEAMARYRQVLEVAPNHIDALYLLGTALLQTGQPVPAVALITRAIELAGEGAGGLGAQHAPLYGNLGNAFQASGQIESAIESYRKGLALAPQLPELHSNLGNALQERGEFAASVECYRTALSFRPDYSECLFNLGNALASLKQFGMAIESYRKAVELRPAYAEALNNLGNALQAVGRAPEAIEALRAAAAADPRSLDIAINLASALAATGKLDVAIASYRRITADHPEAAGAHYNLGNALLAHGDDDAAAESYRRALAAKPDYAEAHYNLAKLQQRRGALQAAEDGFRAALAFRPAFGGVLFDLANLLVDQGRFTEASAQLLHLVDLEPNNPQAHCLLGMALRGEERFDEAVASYRRALELQPIFPAAHYNLGHALADCGQVTAAIAALEAAIAQQPDYPEAHRSLGNALQNAGRDADAAAQFAHALRLQPLITRPASTGAPAFAALLLIAPGRGNTPIDYLTRQTPYDSHILLFLTGHDYDIAYLRDRTDVVFNLVSDVDLGGELLPELGELLRRLGKPVVNHPDRIRPTDRASIARTLSDLPRAVMPPTLRYPRAALITRAGARDIGLEPPLLLRPAGTHGGEDLELITELDQIAPRVIGSAHPAFYVTGFVDYRSADGFFRKYRMIFVGDEILPYHLAIADAWKVHYYRTEMVRHAWMRQEEETFLRDPAAVFDAAHLDALRAIRAAVGLEFFGIDCGLDRDGRLVVFEVNASMLVHANDPEPEFAYKQAPVARIKRAFDAMLAAAAGRAYARA